MQPHTHTRFVISLTATPQQIQSEENICFSDFLSVVLFFFTHTHSCEFSHSCWSSDDGQIPQNEEHVVPISLSAEGSGREGSLQTVKMEPSTLRDHRVTFNLYNPIQTNDLAEKEVVAISFADIMCLCSECEQAHVCVCVCGVNGARGCALVGGNSPLPTHYLITAGLSASLPA